MGNKVELDGCPMKSYRTEFYPAMDDRLWRLVSCLTPPLGEELGSERVDMSVSLHDRLAVPIRRKLRGDLW